MTNPGGTGSPRCTISTSPAPLPPSTSRPTSPASSNPYVNITSPQVRTREWRVGSGPNSPLTGSVAAAFLFAVAVQGAQVVLVGPHPDRVHGVDGRAGQVPPVAVLDAAQRPGQLGPVRVEPGQQLTGPAQRRVDAPDQLGHGTEQLEAAVHVVGRQRGGPRGQRLHRPVHRQEPLVRPA